MIKLNESELSAVTKITLPIQRELQPRQVKQLKSTTIKEW